MRARFWPRAHARFDIQVDRGAIATRNFDRREVLFELSACPIGQVNEPVAVSAVATYAALWPIRLSSERDCMPTVRCRDLDCCNRYALFSCLREGLVKDEHAFLGALIGIARVLRAHIDALKGEGPFRGGEAGKTGDRLISERLGVVSPNCTGAQQAMWTVHLCSLETQLQAVRK